MTSYTPLLLNPPSLSLVAHTQTVAELQEAGVPIVAAHGHEAALLMHLDAVDWLITNLAIMRFIS